MRTTTASRMYDEQPHNLVSSALHNFLNDKVVAHFINDSYAAIKTHSDFLFRIYLIRQIIIGLYWWAKTTASVNTFPFVAKVGQNAKRNKDIKKKKQQKNKGEKKSSIIASLVLRVRLFECVVQHQRDEWD